MNQRWYGNGYFYYYNTTVVDKGLKRTPVMCLVILFLPQTLFAVDIVRDWKKKRKPFKFSIKIYRSSYKHNFGFIHFMWMRKKTKISYYIIIPSILYYNIIVYFKQKNFKNCKHMCLHCNYWTSLFHLVKWRFHQIPNVHTNKCAQNTPNTPLYVWKWFFPFHISSITNNAFQTFIHFYRIFYRTQLYFFILFTGNYIFDSL